MSTSIETDRHQTHKGLGSNAHMGHKHSEQVATALWGGQKNSEWNRGCVRPRTEEIPLDNTTIKEQSTEGKVQSVSGGPLSWRRGSWNDRSG